MRTWPGGEQLVYNRGCAARSVDSSLTDSHSRGVNMTDACDVWKSSTGLSSHILCLITQIANERRRKNYDETTPYQGRAQN